MTSHFSRSEEILARLCLAKPDLLTQAIMERRWHDVATVVAFAETDAPPDLASTDPGLYRETRENITRFYLRGGGSLDLAKIRQLSNSPMITPN
jgi:hypothetical protein